MKPDQVCAAAVEATGLDDFGPPDFEPGLSVYCESVASDAELNDLGNVAVPANVTASLVNRLKVVDWAKTHPEVLAERIEAPLFVIGMFRAGTTLLSNLLDCDEDNRSLLRWESADSAPPSTQADHRSGPRVDANRDAAAMLDLINPGIAAVHHETADGPTECLTLLAQDFKSLLWEAVTNVPAYGRWLDTADQRSAYEYHRLALQILQSAGVRGRWTLKSPHHAIALDALTAVYPDARLVLLHRDPVSLCASVFSLIHTLSRTFSDVDHRPYIAQRWSDVLETSIDRVDAFKQAHPAHPFLDLSYDRFVAAPLETVERIYEFAGAPLSGRAADSMNTYLAENPRGRHGEHRYDLADFGLEAHEVADRFAGYASRYCH